MDRGTPGRIELRRVLMWVGAAVLGAGAATVAPAAPEAAASPSAGGAAPQTHPIESVFAPGFEDLSLSTVRKQVNVDELTKIGRDYANAYRITKSSVSLKEPDKFRMDARVGFISFQYVIAGPRKVIRAPLTKQYDTVGTDPGKRLGPLEVGLITPGTLTGYDVEHAGCFTEEGRRVCQYRLRYSHDKERYELLWVDAERKYVKKRQMYTLIFGKYRMELIYSDAKQVGGIWIPTRIEVRNAEGKLAGVTQQVNIKFNTGLSDDLFKL